jgi:hypothetical protein
MMRRSSDTFHRRAGDVVQSVPSTPHAEPARAPHVVDIPKVVVPEEVKTVPPPTHVVIPAPVPLKQSVKVENLRAVLERIAKPEESNDVRLHNDKKHTKSSEPSKEKLELKQLLQTVLQKEQEEVAPIPEKNSAVPETSATPTPVLKHSVRIESKIENHHQTITPKELERMMRVTTSDTPPH